MKKLPKRLALATHTVRPLDVPQLGEVRGGQSTTLFTVICISRQFTECECKV